MSQPVEVSGYRDLVEVAAGGAGVVYRGTGPGGEHVAIKVLDSPDPDALARFAREVEITGALDHPHIAALLARGSTATGRPYLVLEYAERGSLHDQLRAGGPLPAHAVLAAGTAMADALAFAHGHGVLHGDVKPQNILVRGDSFVLADFGLARRVVADLGAADRFSYRHAAPQVLDGEPASVADDIYSLGSTLYTLLDGRAPFAAADPGADTALGYLRRARTEPFRPLRRPDAPEALLAVVERCLAREPKERYASAGEVRDALAAIPRGGPAWRPLPTAPGELPAAPRQLPADVPGFTGRDAHLRFLQELLPDEDAPVVATITGTAGVGKTALAVHWAHRVAPRFPGGQLFVNLRGHDHGPPADPGEVLARLLRALGVPARDVPADPDERSALYRSVLAGRRVLIVLDNAADAVQVRPLLPGTPGCLVLVTGRSTLAGLVARDGARRLTLDVLTAAEAAILLDRVLGDNRTVAEPRAAGEIAALCGFLPVALRVAAANLADRPHQTLRAYADLLRSGNRLNLLQVDGDAGVRATFELSYERLAPPARRLFRLLGRYPGHDIGTLAAAALAGQPEAAAREMLTALTGAYLVQEPAPDRYALHDLLRAYAAELSEPDEPDAIQRLLDWCLYVTDTAVRLARPYRRGLPLVFGPPPTGAPELPDFGAAVAFLEAEQANLVAATRYAAQHGFDAAAWQLPHLLWRYFELRGYLDDWLGTAHLALAAAVRAGDRAGEAASLHSLAVANRRRGRSTDALAYDQKALDIQRELADRAAQAATLNSLAITVSNTGRFADASGYQRSAVELYQQAGDLWGEASVLGNLGVVNRRLGDYPEALANLTRGLELFRQTGDRRNEAGMLGNLGLVYRGLGDHAAAADHIRPAIELYALVGDPLNEARALGNLGTVYQRLGRLAEAADQMGQALLLFRRIAERRGEAEALANLGAVYQRLGRTAEADTYLRDALALIRALSDPAMESEVRNDMGLACRETGRPAQALAHHRAALELAAGTGVRYEQARAYEGIARAAPDDPGSAQHLRRALALYTELGVPEADELRARLGGLTA